MLLVPRDLPQLQVVDVGTDDLLVPPATILHPDEVGESVVHMCPTRVEEAASRAQIVEEEELMVLKSRHKAS